MSDIAWNVGPNGGQTVQVAGTVGHECPAVPATPAVWVDPRRCGGEPCIGGTRVPVFMVADMVLSDGVDAAVRTWAPDRSQVLGACWYAALHGPKRFKVWRKWAKRWADYTDSNIYPDPPMAVPVGDRGQQA